MVCSPNRFPIEDTVIVDVCDDDGRTIVSRRIHKRSPSFVVNEIARYAKWRSKADEVHVTIIGDYDCREADRFFSNDWDIRRFIY